MTIKCYIDFETRSAFDLKKGGAWEYALHPTTSIMCLAYAVDDKPVQLLTNVDADLWDDWQDGVAELEALARAPEVLFHAHNAQFEQCIWKHIMVAKLNCPPIPIERWRCTAAKAANMSLPRNLEDVGDVLRLPIQKDMDGNRVLMKLCKPRRGKFGGPIVFWEYEDCPDDFEKLYAYCKTDVETERLVDQALPDLTKREQRIWFLDQRMNFKGFHVDIPAIHQTTGFIERTISEMTQEFREIVRDDDLDTPNQVAKFRAWLADNGCELPDLQKATVGKVVKDETLPSHVRQALSLRLALSKISTSKYNAFLNRCSTTDHRVRDNFLYCAAITNRWGGRGVQVQNLPRGAVDSGEAIQCMLLDDYDWLKCLYPDLMEVYSSSIRGMIDAAPGKYLVAGDFNAIEARVNAWVAGQEDVLEIFRNGGDLYCEEASTTFDRPIAKANKYERSVGKVEVLALGYGGGIGAFGTMAKGYNVDLTPAYQTLWDSADIEEREKAVRAYEMYLSRTTDDDPLDEPNGLAADIIKQRWRVKNKAIASLWGQLEEAAIEAVLSGQKVEVGGYNGRPKIVYGMNGEHLICKLPSGSYIVYPFARVSMKETPWGEQKRTLSYRTNDSGNGYKFERTYTYGGKLCENIVQAIARDILADAMVRAEDEGWNTVLQIHDEIVTEESERTPEELEAIMSIVPPWADGLPIAVEAWKGERFKK